MTRRYRRYARWLVALLLICQVITSLNDPVSALVTATGDGIMMYGQAANTTPRWRTYAGVASTFGAANATIAGAVPSTITVRTSPTRQEAIAGYVTTSGVLQVMCYNGASWANEWSVTVGGTGTSNRFDIAYETTTGDVMVAYSTNVATTNEIAYRTKPGSTGCGTTNWASAVNFDALRTSGTVLWIRLEGSLVTGSNVIGMAWSDSNNDLSVTQWNDTSWTIAEPATVLDANIERISAAGDVRSFDIAYESLTGYIMIAWSPSDASAQCTIGTNCLKFARYTASWGSSAIPTVGDEGTNIDIAPNPANNEIVLGAIGNRFNALSTAYWSGGAWTATLDADDTVTAPFAGSKLVAVGWTRASGVTRSVVAYADATATTSSISYMVGNAGAFTDGGDFVAAPVPGAFQWFDMMMDPVNKDRVLLVYSDANSDLFAKRLTMTSAPAFTWTNADGSAALETSLARATYSPFSFAYWRFIPPAGTLGVDIVDGSGVSVTSPAYSMTGVASSFSCQATTGTLGSSLQRIRVTNTTPTPGWTLSIAPTGGATSSWSSGTANYDFNDPTGSQAGCSDGGDADAYAGQLNINPSVGTLTPQSGCSNTGVTLGSSTGYNQGTIDSVTLMSASSSVPFNCYWELTGATVSQTIPSLQPSGSYSAGMTLTIVAN